MDRLPVQMIEKTVEHSSIQDLKELRITDKRMEAIVDREIEKRHTRLFGPVPKSLQYKIKDLELHEISKKLGKTMFKSDILNNAIRGKGYGLGLLDPYMTLYNMYPSSYIFRTMTSRFIEDANPYGDDADMWSHTVPRATSIIAIRDALIDEYPAYRDNIMDGYRHLIKLFSTMPNTHDKQDNAGAQLVMTYEAHDVDFSSDQLPRDELYEPRLGLVLTERIVPLINRVPRDEGLINNTRQLSFTPNPVLKVIQGLHAMDSYVEGYIDCFKELRKHKLYIQGLLRDVRLTDEERETLEGYNDHVMRKKLGFSTFDYQRSQQRQQRQQRQAQQQDDN